MPRIRVALLVCTNVIGGHEYQAAALGRSLSEHVDVTVFVNRAQHSKIFQDEGLDVTVADGLLLKTGALPHQVWYGLRRGTVIRNLVRDYDHVIVSAGAVEASVSAGLALRGFLPTSMYLPSFYDRVPVWGWKGHVYNCALGISCKLFDRIITINRIQARVIRAFSGVRTLVVGNKIRNVNLPIEQGPARLIFIGRLDKQKRVDELLEWLDSSENPIKNLILIGEGPLRPLLEQQAQELIYLDCKFFGWMAPEEQDLLIHANDVLLLNSQIEGEPLVIKEARARSMKVVARDIVGTRGVTTKSERFNTREELIDRLISIILRSTAINNLNSSRSPERMKSVRERDIKNLIKALN